jgi:hypothetical protein
MSPGTSKTVLLFLNIFAVTFFIPSALLNQSL